MSYTPNDMAIACGKRLAGIAPIDGRWTDIVAERGIELAEDGALTIALENGQTFHVQIAEVTR